MQGKTFEGKQEQQTQASSTKYKRWMKKISSTEDMIEEMDTLVKENVKIYDRKYPGNLGYHEMT